MKIKFENKRLITEGFEVTLSKNIKNVLYKNGVYVVLFDIPSGSYETENIVGLNNRGNIIWTVENAENVFPIAGKSEQSHQYVSLRIYEGIAQQDESVFIAIPFWGPRYLVDYTTGKIVQKLAANR